MSLSTLLAMALRIVVEWSFVPASLISFSDGNLTIDFSEIIFEIDITVFAALEGAIRAIRSVGDKALEFFNSNFSSLFQNVKEILNAMSPVLSVIVTLSLIMAVSFVIIKTGTVIYNSYMKDSDARQRVSVFVIVRRALTSLAIAVMAPTVIISLFLVSVQLGLTAGSTIMGQTTMLTENNAVDIFYDDIKTYGISYDTICYNNYRDTYSNRASSYIGENWSTSTSTVYIYNPSDTYNAAEKTALMQFTNSTAKDGMEYLYKTYCSTYSISSNAYSSGKFDLKPVRVAERLMSDPEISQYFNLSTFPVISTSHISLSADTTTGQASDFLIALGAGLSFILDIISSFFAIMIVVYFLYLTTVRISDLFSGLMLIWYYAGNHITSTPQENSLKALAQKVGAICLTQFYYTVMITIWVFLNFSTDAVIYRVLITYGFFQALTKGSAMVNDILADSGGGSAAAQAKAKAQSIINSEESRANAELK